VTQYRITVKGVVQGVGFRPFVKRLADRQGLAGVVSNTAAGVLIEVETQDEEQAAAFYRAIQREAPPIARIESCVISPAVERRSFTDFKIVASQPQTGAFTLTSPDVATCADCLREIFDPGDRRFGYPFTNCTNCGPRYSITLRVPYDRANTTMAPFSMCVACAEEYANPADRRFHAEPNACPICGPKLSMPLQEAVDALRDGRIVALKGLGGFQLACDAHCASAVEKLRERKRRSRKPFAVMMRDPEIYCYLNRQERELLASPAAPILLLQMKRPLPDAVAPGLREIGVMLPYTPLHHLLFRDGLSCLVMTSGNISEEPIVIANEDAHSKLSRLADVVVTHDRDIFMRIDDSVVRYPRVLRRARGYAPSAIDLGFDVPEVLACGGELKNTFCLTKGSYAILSQHIGDLENFETLTFFEETLRNLKQVYRSEPCAIAHDLHPDYLTTRWAAQQPGPKIAVQHHHAHIASCMAENGRRDRVIGVAFDGTGYGTDGQIWGGEFLVCDYDGFKREAHLRYVPLIGGDRAAREGWRMAAAYLFDSFGTSRRSKLFDQLLSRPGNLMTSSCGRLFDAVASLTGLCQSSSYEGEAAMLLEAAADGSNSEPYPFTGTDTRPMIYEIAKGVEAPSRISDRFHSTLAAMIEAACMRLREDNGIGTVCLSGGTFQNCTLLRRSIARLERQGFEVLTHSRVPTNDGGLSLGQAVIAGQRRDLCA